MDDSTEGSPQSQNINIFPIEGRENAYWTGNFATTANFSWFARANVSDVLLTTRYDVINNAAVQTVFYLLYLTIFILGVFGNVLVCFVVGRNKAMQTVTNFFITNLALSDILLCVLAVPFTPLYSFLKSWIFGSMLCHLVSYAQGTSVYISTLTLTSIAIDRFFVIIYPFKPRMKLTTCVLIICSIWAFSLCATLPYGIFMNLREYRNKYYCDEAWPSEEIRQIFGTLTTGLQFVVPFVIITFCYIRVSLKLSDRVKAKPGSKSSKKEEQERERKRRTNRMLIAMVTIFGLSWFPLNVANLLNDFYIPAGRWQYFNLAFFMAHAVAMSSTCYNPFLYAWLNENFRKEFKQVLPCFDVRRNPKSIRERPSCFQRTEKTCNGNEETIRRESNLAPQNSVRTTVTATSPPPQDHISMTGVTLITKNGPDGSYTYKGPSGVYTGEDDSMDFDKMPEMEAML